MTTKNDNHILIDDNGQQWLTVKAAAALVGISTSTMRRKAKVGEITCKMEKMTHGETMYLLFEDVERVKSAMSMLAVKRESSNQEMAFAVSRMVGEYLQERDNQVMDRLQEVEQTHHEEIQSLTGQLDEIKTMLHDLQEKQEAPLMEEEKPTGGIKGWFSNLRKK